MQKRHNHKRGFNLIEAAIMLAVVGGVIGGIWVAAAAINKSIKWRQTEEGWLYYFNYITNHLSYQTGAQMGVKDIESYLKNAAGFPDGWSCCGPYGSIKDPNGYNLFVQAKNNSFLMWYGQSVDKNTCIRWMTMTFNKILGQQLTTTPYFNFPDAPSYWTCVSALGSNYDIPKGFSLPPSFYAKNCCAATNRISIEYRYTRQN